MRLLGYFVLGTLLFLPNAALGAEMDPKVRQLIVVWFPLFLFFVLWIVFWRILGGKRQKELIERSFVHMERLEEKLDRLIELQEQDSRDS